MKPEKKVYSLHVSRAFLDRQACLAEGRRILREMHISGMTEKQLAVEIFAHTRVYFLCDMLERFHIPLGFVKRRADPVDMEDGGDRPFRRLCYLAAWHVPLIRRKGR